MLQRFRGRRWLLRIISVVALIGLWQLLSSVVSFEAVTPPLKSLSVIVEQTRHGILLPALAVTMKRVVEVFALSMAGGTLAGIAIGWSRVVDGLFGLWVTVIITVPGLIYLIVSYIAFGISTDRGLIVGCSAVVTPTILVAVVQGTKAVDHKLIDMARVYGYRGGRVLWHMILPQLMPYIFGSARYALPLTWQMVTFAELVGRPNGFGYQIYYNYQVSNIPGVWAYSVAFVLVALVIEFGIIATLQRHLFRWRPEPVKR